MRGLVLDSKTHKYYLLNGDSAVSGLAHDLAIPVKNLAFCGMDSAKGLEKMAKNIADIAPGTIAFIEFGGNDVDHPWAEIALAPEKEHIPNVSRHNFEKNIREMVLLNREKGLIPVLITLPPIHSRRYLNWFCKDIPAKDNILKWLGDIELIHKTHAAYSTIISKVAESLSCSLIDIRRAFMEKKDFKEYLCDDGIHPNQEGHNLMRQVYVNYMRGFSFS
jgi:lysophospholipase L1-like esterase